MSVYEILCLLGIPTLIIVSIKLIYNKIRKNKNDIKLMKEGIQALLRSQMIADYNKWEERGYAPIYARQNFENCWVRYHSLGANGVMDDLHNKFLELPTEKESEDK